MNSANWTRNSMKEPTSPRHPRRRCSTVIERHTHLIQLYLMLDLGYELPDLNEVLLWASRNLKHTPLLGVPIGELKRVGPDPLFEAAEIFLAPP